MTRGPHILDFRKSAAVLQPGNDAAPQENTRETRNKRIPDALYALGIAPIEEEQLGKTG